MGEITADVNWIAVIVGFVVSYALGWAWYGPLFGKAWVEGIGRTYVKDMKPAAAPMVMQAVGTFLLSWVVGVTAANEALLTIILITATFAVLMAAGGLFASKKNNAIAIEVGFLVAMVVVMIVVQGIL